MHRLDRIVERMLGTTPRSAVFILCARARRLRRAAAYAFGNLTPEAAQLVMLDCRLAAGWHPLIVLATEDALEEAYQTYVYHPQIESLVAAACATVEYKYEPSGDTLYHARGWAIDLIARYAAEDDVKLTPLDQLFDTDVTLDLHSPTTEVPPIDALLGAAADTPTPS